MTSNRGGSTVLFVDDEPDVLDGLRLSLRKLRGDFSFLFATSADEAIAVLETRAVDMVITDMRMPDRNGADLLEEVRFRFPDVIRYVLSGQAEDRLVHRSVAVAHRWLNKPCDRDVLIEAIVESTDHRGGLSDPPMRRAIGTVDALPSHPDLYRAFRDELANPRLSVDRLVELAAVDPALTAKLLQWANSVYQDGPPVYDVRRAIERIGVEDLGHLSSANDVVRPASGSEVVPGFGVELFHHYAADAAAVAAALADRDDADLVRAATLLSNIGLLIEAGHLPDRLAAAYERAIEGDAHLVPVERHLYGRSHAELAASLLALWGLPGALVDLVGGSHGLPDPAAAVPLPPLDAVRAGRLIVQTQPVARTIGAPHLLAVHPELAEALDRWAGQPGVVAALQGRFLAATS